MRPLWVWVLVTSVVVACDDGGSSMQPIPDLDAAPITEADAGPEDAAPLPLDAATPFIEIGGGTRPGRFVPYEEGAEVPIIQGNQGGFHVWGGFRGAGFDDVDVRILFSLTLDDEVIAAADYTEFDLDVDAEGLFNYAGVTVIYYENSRVEPSSGQLMTLSCEVHARDGTVVTDSIDLVPVCCE